MCLLPGICPWRGTSGCSINITSGPKRHMTPKWTFQRRRLRHITISHPLRHTAARPQRLRQDQQQRQIHAIKQRAADKGPPQSGNRCTSGLEPVRHTCPSRLHASAGLMHECLPRPPSWWNGQTLGWLEKTTDSLLSVFFRLLLRGIVDARLHHDREDAKAR